MKSIAFNREFAMPSAWTFTILPIKKLLDRYVGNGKGWVDPFAGNNSPAEITNDMNPERKATHHMEATEFCMTSKDSLTECFLIRRIPIGKFQSTTKF
jgi:hypothetical protein